MTETDPFNAMWHRADRPHMFAPDVISSDYNAMLTEIRRLRDENEELSAEREASVEKAHASYLSPPDFHRLDWACRPITAAFDAPVYLVGSVLRTPEYRDIDLRLILPDDDERFTGPLRLVINIAVSDLIAKTAGLARPIDFQIQTMTEADAEDGARNPLGVTSGAARRAGRLP
jgi:hypothetical protein